MVTFENGSSRSEARPMYELVPRQAIDAIAERLTLGYRVHGRENWKNGGPLFFAETKRHMAAHMFAYLEGDKSEDQLSAIITNAAMLCWWERKRRDEWEMENTSSDPV